MCTNSKCRRCDIIGSNRPAAKSHLELRGPEVAVQMHMGGLDDQWLVVSSQRSIQWEESWQGNAPWPLGGKYMKKTPETGRVWGAKQFHTPPCRNAAKGQNQDMSKCKSAWAASFDATSCWWLLQVAPPFICNFLCNFYVLRTINMLKQRIALIVMAHPMLSRVHRNGWTGQAMVLPAAISFRNGFHHCIIFHLLNPSQSCGSQSPMASEEVPICVLWWKWATGWCHKVARHRGHGKW